MYPSTISAVNSSPITLFYLQLDSTHLPTISTYIRSASSRSSCTAIALTYYLCRTFFNSMLKLAQQPIIMYNRVRTNYISSINAVVKYLLYKLDWKIVFLHLQCPRIKCIPSFTVLANFGKSCEGFDFAIFSSILSSLDMSMNNFYLIWIWGGHVSKQ